MPQARFFQLTCPVGLGADGGKRSSSGKGSSGKGLIFERAAPIRDDMDIPEYFRNLDEQQQKGSAANADADRQEVLRRKLNAEKVSQVLRGIVRPKLVEAAQKIKAANRYAEVETKETTEGRFIVSVVLKACREEGFSEKSRFKLDYIGNDNTAVVQVQIRVPSPDQNPFREIGLFPFDSIGTEDVDKHIELLIRMAFR
jgi:hypothetical protein